MGPCILVATTCPHGEKTCSQMKSRSPMLSMPLIYNQNNEEGLAGSKVVAS